MPISNVILQGVDLTKAAFRSLIASTKRTTKGARALLGVWRDMTVVMGGLKTVFKGTVRAMNKVVDAAQRQQKAEIGVLIGMARTEKETLKSFLAFRKWAAAVQEATAVGDEYIFELAKIGINLGNMTRGQVQDAISASLDFAEAMGVDARTGMLNLSKVLATGAADFGRMGFIIESTGSNADKFTEALGKMRSEMAPLVGSLPILQLQKLKNSWGDLIESLGFLITATGTWKVVLGALTSGVGKLADLIRDPAFIEKWGKAFDEFITGAVKLATQAIGGLLLGIGNMVELLTKIALKIGAIDWTALAPPGTAERIAAAKDELSRATAVLAVWNRRIHEAARSAPFFKQSFVEMRLQVGRAKDVLGALKTAQDDTSNSMQDMGRAFLEAGKSFENSVLLAGITTLESSFAPLIAAAKKFFATLTKGGQETSSRFRTSMIAIRDEIVSLTELADQGVNFLTDELKTDIEEEVQALGVAWGSTLADAMATGIRESDSISGVFREMGTQAKENFLGQMTQEAFAPMTATFGLLAKAAALPFKIVGTIINDLILQPIAEFATSIITTLLKGLVKLFIAEKASQAAGVAALVAFNAAYLPTLALLTAGAAAAAISTFGASLGQAALAVIAVKAAGATAFTGFEEGGLVFPSGSGGTHIVVAEREAEFITPISKAAEFASAFGGGGVVINIDHVSGSVTADDVDALVDLLQDRLADAGLGARF